MDVVELISIKYPSDSYSINIKSFPASSVAVQKLRLGSVAPKESDLHGAAQALIRLQVLAFCLY